jgi:mediator of RNA polymerase II transcription subunit 4
MSQPNPGQSRTAFLAKNEPPSMTSILLEPLTLLQSLSQTLFNSLYPAPSKPPLPPPPDAFLDCDRAIAAALQLAHIHQIKQRKIETLKNEILDLEATWREICSELENGKMELEQMIAEGEERIKAIDEAKQGQLTFLPDDQAFQPT